MLVVGLVYLLNVIQKLFEQFTIAVPVDERREGLIELMERLDAREDVVRPLQPLPHVIGHFDLPEAGIERIGGRVFALFSVFGPRGLDTGRLGAYEHRHHHPASREEEGAPAAAASLSVGRGQKKGRITRGVG